MKVYVVVNPRSANGATGRRWAEIQAQLTRSTQQAEVAFTEAPMHAVTLVRQALHQGFDTIVAVGGDGTINETVNGFFENGRPINPEASLAILPRGTGGDFRRTFGWDFNVKSAAERLQKVTTQPLDIGLLEYERAEGGREQRYFANVASLGVSGRIVSTVNASSKALGGKMTFMWGSMKALSRWSDVKVRFRVDTGAWEETSVTTLAVANGQYFGGGMKVAPAAQTDDGWLDVTIWSNYSLADFIFKSAALYSGAHVKFSNTRCLKAKTFEVESDAEVLVECDGEQPGRLPCRFSVVPGAIRLRI